jgi:hypothetical protein
LFQVWAALFERHNAQFASLGDVVEREKWSYKTFVLQPGGDWFDVGHYLRVLKDQPSKDAASNAVLKPANFSGILDKSDGPWNFHVNKV